VETGASIVYVGVFFVYGLLSRTPLQHILDLRDAAHRLKTSATRLGTTLQ